MLNPPGHDEICLNRPGLMGHTGRFSRSKGLLKLHQLTPGNLY